MDVIWKLWQYNHFLLDFRQWVLLSISREYISINDYQIKLDCTYIFLTAWKLLYEMNTRTCLPKGILREGGVHLSWVSNKLKVTPRPDSDANQCREDHLWLILMEQWRRINLAKGNELTHPTSQPSQLPLPTASGKPAILHLYRGCQNCCCPDAPGHRRWKITFD